MPDVRQIVAPHFHPSLSLIGFNYTPAASISLHHYHGGWSTALRLCRGIVFDLSGSLIARPFQKFQNFGEIGGAWGTGYPEITIKEDGHLVIAFCFQDKVIVKTRGSFCSEAASIAAESLAGLEIASGDTVLAELIHPKTKVGVEYGNRHALVLIGAFRAGIDLGHDDLCTIAEELGLEPSRLVEMERDQLLDVLHRDGDGTEGFVARFPDGHRLKFKWRRYVESGKR